MNHSEYNVILTGFMGTGKSTIGRLLAQQLHFKFVDTDRLIEETAGQSIPEIFTAHGEARFRELEQQVARTLSSQTGQVISTGGRMMLDPHNRDILEPTGPIYCLTASVDEILRRVMADAEVNERPLLKGENPKQKIISLLHKRREKYGQFPQIDTEKATPEEICEQILAKLASF